MAPGPFGGPEELEAALGAAFFLIFKHSPICPVSARAFAEYEAFAAARPEVETAWIDVIGSRPWSLRVEEATGIRHESPQALLIRDGEVVWHASHSRITGSALEGALGD